MGLGMQKSECRVNFQIDQIRKMILVGFSERLQCTAFVAHLGREGRGLEFAFTVTAL
jgi:hypothetical protein